MSSTAPVTPGNTQRLTLDISNCPEETRIFELSGQQAMSAPYELTARFICPIPNLKLKSLIRQAAVINVYYKNESRYFHGIISDASMDGELGQSYQYTITLVPKLWFMNYRTNCRIFQHKSVTDIVTTLLKEAGMTEQEYRFRLKEHYKPLNYTVQFNESDLTFISRLLERHGIHYHFEHQSDKHLLVFADTNEALPKIQTEQGSRVELRPRNGLEPEYATCEQFSLGSRIGFDRASHIGFDLTRPGQMLEQSQSIDESPNLEHYSFHEHLSFDNADTGQHFIDQSLQAYKAWSHFADTRSDVIQLEPGCRFSLINHPRADFNQRYLIHNMTFSIKQDGALEQYSSSDGGGFYYQNHAHLIPDSVTYKPLPLTPKPQLDYQDGVFVTGPEGEEIHTDKYGRIKVQFPWDREGQNNEYSSCWLPVSQSWVGNQWGKIHIPRIGHEVLVSFINGDPDQPIVVGSLYNGRNRPPYKLPEHKTRSTTKTNSSKGGKGYNEIRIEDKKGQEQLAVFAEKDIDNRVKHDRREHIGHDRHLVVEKDRFEQINNNLNIQVDGHRISETGKALHRQAGDNIHTRIGKDLYVEAGNEIHIKAGSKLVFDAGNSLIMNAGGSVMQTGAGGIGFNGATIRINAGGSPGSGSGASALDPEAPQEADKDYPGYKALQRRVIEQYKQLKPQVQAFEHIPSEPEPPAVKKTEQQWLAVLLVDNDNNTVSGIPYKIICDNTIIRQGSLDKYGYALLPGIEADNYQVIFNHHKSIKTGTPPAPDFAEGKDKTPYTTISMGSTHPLEMKKVNRFQLEPNLFIHMELDVNKPERRNHRFTLMTDDSSWNQSVYLKELPNTKTDWVELEFYAVPQTGTFHLIEDPDKDGQEPLCLLAGYQYNDLKKLTPG